MKREGGIDLETLALKLAPLVLAEIARLVGRASEPRHYASRKGEGPTGIPDRQWKAIAKTIGRKPYPAARWYVVDRGTYETWLASTVSPTDAAPTASPWTPQAALAEVRLRPSRQAR